MPFPGRGVVRKGRTSWGAQGWLSHWWRAPAPTARGQCREMQWSAEEGTFREQTSMGFSWLCSPERGLQGRGQGGGARLERKEPVETTLPSQASR